MVFSASAEAINYRDYEGSVKVDGENDIVTIDLPVSWFNILIAMPDGTGIHHHNGHSVSYTIPYATHRLNVYLVPFGAEIGAYNAPYNGRYLSMDNIPSDAEFYMQFGITTDTPNSFSVASYQERVYSVNDNFASLYAKNDYTGGPAGTYALSSVFPSIAADGWFPEYIFYLDSTGSSFEGTSVSLVVYNFHLEVSISSLYRLQEETGRTNELLTEVNRQLADQGITMDQILDQQQQTNDKLDNIVDHVPTPENPGFQDSVDDLEDIENGALDKVEDGMDDADQVFTSVFDVLGDYLQSFAAVSIIFETFADMPFFTALLSVSLALGIVAALLGIGLDAVRSSSRSSARSSKKGRSG